MTGTAARRYPTHLRYIPGGPVMLVPNPRGSMPGWRRALGHALGTAVSFGTAAVMFTGLTAVGATTTVANLVSALRGD